MFTEVSQDLGLVSGAISAITRHIRENELAPGEKLPSEMTLSQQLGVSRTVVREAFRSLSAMRLIDMSPGKRATVATLDHGAMSLMFEHGIHTEQINIQQIYDVRRTIEVRTVTLAALRRTDSEALDILHHAKQMEVDFGNNEKVMEHDLAFHLAVAKASKNPVFELILGAFQNVTRQTWPIGWKSRTSDEQRHAAGQLHIAIGQAIAAGDPQIAATLMAKHFDESVHALIAAGIA
ncbi:FadR family transcriptional regulator [Agrobacterium sp. AGB01]|uniref:FadR/GntR family transcriptional regulator n=1 Tax=Agrobacterium sp. AGB01 TaxID=2769302 RepID=UPI00177B32C1|nr:FadR/GntR family transcriptional regulator [Agrobacterium sp. AGB01]MBD9385553.1 FadR family transcriptional regulator [Agrobacterium sp. AGB01]